MATEIYFSFLYTAICIVLAQKGIHPEHRDEIQAEDNLAVGKLAKKFDSLHPLNYKSWL
jgi:hypothetical protein